MQVNERGSLLIGLIAIVFTLGSIYPERVSPFFGILMYLSFLIILYLAISSYLKFLVSNYAGLVDTSLRPPNPGMEHNDIKDIIIFRIFQKYYPKIERTYKIEYLLFLYIISVTAVLLVFVVHNPYKGGQQSSYKDWAAIGVSIAIMVIFMITVFAFRQKTETKFNVRVSPMGELDINDKKYQRFSVYLNNEGNTPVYCVVTITFPEKLEVTDKRGNKLESNTYRKVVIVDPYPRGNNVVLKFKLKYVGEEHKVEDKIKIDIFKWTEDRTLGSDSYEVGVYMYKK